MDSIRKKIIDISSIGIADILSAGIAGIFWFYIASMVGPKNYGEITYLLSIATLASGLALLGSNYTLMVYSAKKIPIQSTLFLLSSVIGFISAITIFFFFADLGLSLVILGYIILALVTADLLGKKLYKTYSKYVIIQKILMVILGIGLYYVMKEPGILLGIGLSYLPLIKEMINRFKENKINFKLLIEKKNFILNNFALNITGTLYGSLDKLIIVPLLGFTILGNYSLGLQFYTIISLLPALAIKYLVAQDATGIVNKKLKKIMVLCSVGIALLGSIFAPMIIGEIFPKFENAEEIIRIISFGVIPSTITSAYLFPKFWANEKNKIILATSIIVLIIQIIGIVLLGPIYGAKGIAVSFLISLSIGTGFAIIMDRVYNSSQKVN
jgi:O-antigen/teichoic acid export membrane protein